MSTERQVSAVADGPHDADLCTLKSYQLLHETQLPPTECAMLHVTMNGRTCRPSKLSSKCMAVRFVDFQVCSIDLEVHP